MPIRSLIASLVIAALLGVGAVYLMGREGATLVGFIDLLFMRGHNAAMICTIIGWASVVSGVLAILTGFAAFLELDEDDGYRQRGFPKGVPIVFLLIALALFWAALACEARNSHQRVVIPIDSSAAARVDTPPETVATEVEPARAEAPPAARAPRIATIETPLIWDFKYPLVRGESYVNSPVMPDAIAALFPADDPNGDVRAMLCGKAWVAFAGAASEEGPRDRNERRARRRAEIAAGAASDWLDAHEDCQRPVILGVNLGQHAATTVPLDDAGRSTGYQRQTLVAFRDGGTAIDAAAAAQELRAYLANEENLEALLGGRRYLAPPEVFRL